MTNSPISSDDIRQLLTLAIRAALEAHTEILDIYHSPFKVEYKDDYSPVTLADRNADRKIREILAPSEYYVMSEETPVLDYQERKGISTLWIVDPLDGTKEFVKKNGEFTTNIALVQDGKPLLGVVGIPTEQLLYIGAAGIGSFRMKQPDKNFELNELLSSATRLPENKKHNGIRLIGSRSHISKKTEAFLEELKIKYGNAELVRHGSSIKLCKIAEGVADVYPRFSPISEWDVAAGHAVILNAGGRVIDPKTQEEQHYNKEDLLQYPFVALKQGVNWPL